MDHPLLIPNGLLNLVFEKITKGKHNYVRRQVELFLVEEESLSLE